MADAWIWGCKSRGPGRPQFQCPFQSSGSAWSRALTQEVLISRCFEGPQALVLGSGAAKNDQRSQPTRSSADALDGKSPAIKLPAQALPAWPGRDQLLLGAAELQTPPWNELHRCDATCQPPVWHRPLLGQERVIKRSRAIQRTSQLLNPPKSHLLRRHLEP